MSSPIKLFWTGGWDSTFRLLQLMLLYKRKVQPYYIVDHNRKSLLNELLAMDSITEHVFVKFPETKNLLLPLKLELLTNLKPDKQIEEAYDQMKQNNKLGVQYEWLARFCKQWNIPDMELSHEQSVDPQENIRFKKVFGKIDVVEDDCGNHLISNKTNNQADTLLLFGNLKIVLFDITKPEMMEVSKQEGFFEIMQQTWFCHVPTKRNKPCGKCVPCRSTYFEQMQWRFPFPSKIRHLFWKTGRNVIKFISVSK